MTIRELRAKTGMSQREFADYFGINYRTLQGWEGRRRPPEGIEAMMTRIVELENELEKLRAELKENSK